jgi:hypothetical protein
VNKFRVQGIECRRAPDLYKRLDRLAPECRVQVSRVCFFWLSYPFRVQGFRFCARFQSMA